VIIKNVRTTLEVVLRDKNDDPLTERDLVVKINCNGEDITTPNEIKEVNDGIYQISFIPNRCGDHMISVLLNGDHILNSPYKYVRN